MEQIEITRLGARGDGIGTGPDGDVFAARTLPGELVHGEIVDGRMGAPKIDRPSGMRVKPVCPHYSRCGGCVVQHASDGFVADWKREIVARALGAHGIEASLRTVATSAPGSRRRAVYGLKRTKSGVQIGFHGRADATIVDAPDCAVLHPDLLSVRGALAELALLGASRKGEVKAGVTVTEGGVDVDIREAKPLEPARITEAVAVVHGHRLARLTWNGEVVAQRRPPVIRLGGVPVQVPPGAFLQATEDGEAALRAGVEEAIGDAGPVVDLFAGCGTFALPLARRVPVRAFEGEQELLDALHAAWRAGDGMRPLTVERRDLFRRPLLPLELKGVAAAVIDPPRAGAEAQMRCLAEARVPLIASVSCNPVTFARDTALLLSSGYRLDWVQVVDQFRWSSHVEVVARLSLA
ncbi:MAG: class I SAM-dependent RNA methyltransferase [Pseudomonadota bacterium]